MDDDFNTPKAFAVFFDFINKSNRFLENNEQVDAALCRHSLELLLKLGGILTLFQPKKIQQDETVLLEKLQKLILKYNKEIESRSIEETIKILIEIREEARKKKDWEKADRIRSELQDLGFELQDTNKGPVWKKK
jgi:cysteinyl-tRNA synthetase